MNRWGRRSSRTINFLLLFPANCSTSSRARFVVDYGALCSIGGCCEVPVSHTVDPSRESAARGGNHLDREHARRYRRRQRHQRRYPICHLPSETVTNSTFGGNTVAISGGTVSVYDSTISGGATGIDTPNLTIGNSIVAGNGTDLSSGAVADSLVHNLIGNIGSARGITNGVNGIR